MIKRMTIILASLLFAAPAIAQNFDPVRVQAYTDGLMREAMEANHVAGATIAVVKDGKLVLAKGYGQARMTPKPRAADADTLFQVASISKTPVYLAIMQLVEAGKLKLDDPANAHLPPALRIPDQGFVKPILIRHLMTHSAGFEDTAIGHLFMNAPERLLPLQKYAARYKPLRVNEPGLQTAYSNYALVLLGAIIEQKSGLDFPTYMETRILRPLGMARSTYRDPYTQALANRLGLPAPMDAIVAANITQQLGEGPPKWREMSPEFVTSAASAGGLHASANDMARYALALSDPALLEKAGVLKAATFAAMIKPDQGLPNGVRSGFMNYYFQGGRRGFGHAGAMAYGASDLIISPDLKLGVFVSTNGRGGFAFANDLVRRMLKDLAPLPELAFDRSPENKALAQSLSGNWITNRRPMHRTEAAYSFFISDKSLTAEPDGDLLIGSLVGDKQLYQPIGKGVWQSATDLSRLTAANNGNGSMTLWYGDGAGSAVRANPFQQPLLMTVLLGLTMIFGWVAAWRGGRRALAENRESHSEALAGSSIAVAGLVWALGIGAFLTTLGQSAGDGGAALIFSYPGPARYIAWTIGLAVLLSAAALWFSRAVHKAPQWSRWRKAKHMGLLSLFGLCSYFCWTVGLVGYSGH